MNRAITAFGLLLLSCLNQTSEGEIVTFFPENAEVFGETFDWTADPFVVEPLDKPGSMFLVWGECGNGNSTGLDFEIQLDFPGSWTVGFVQFGGLNNDAGDSQFSVRMFDENNTALDLNSLTPESTNGLAATGWTYEPSTFTWHYSVLQGSLTHSATLSGPLSGVAHIVVDVDDHLGCDTFVLDIESTNNFLIGDVNCDGVVDLLDVAPFVDAISAGDYVPKADINQDGVVNLLDVAPFVELLSGG